MNAVRRIFASLIWGLLLTGGLFAGDAASSRAEKDAPKTAPTTTILNAPGGPVVLGLEVRLDGRSLPASALSVHTESVGEVDAILFEQLDLNKDGVLTFEELQQARVALAPLDADDDETISKAELLAASHKRASDASPTQRQPPQLSLRFELFDRRQSRPRVSVAPAKNPSPYQWRSPSTESGLLEVNGLKVSLIAKRTHGSSGDRSAFYALRFDVVDRDKNNHLDRTEFPALGLPDAEFGDVDTNGDGRIAREELTGYLNKQAGGSAGRHVVIAIADESSSLFDLLDTNTDGRLSPREMNSAVARLRTLDHNHDHRLTLGKMRTQSRIEVGVQRPDNNRVVRPIPGRQRQTAQPTRNDRGPDWFQKMDRNYDGDVSWREFLGPRAVFDRIDTDHDGLLSPEEAEHAK